MTPSPTSSSSAVVGIDGMDNGAGNGANGTAVAGLDRGAVISPADQAALVERLVARHGEAQRARIAAGVRRVAERWTAGDGDAAALAELCAAHFVADADDLARLLGRFEQALDWLGGHLYEIRRGFRRWSDLRGDEMPGVDDLLATFNPAPDLSDQLYRQKLAFIALLNFHRPELAEMLRDGPSWGSQAWAEARICQAFGPRIPPEVDALARELHHRANTFVSGFHVPVDHMVDANGKTWFEPGRKLIAHWLIREQLKAGYNQPDGLPLQRALAWVMRRTIDGSLPSAVLGGSSEAAWDPEANTLGGRPVAADDTIGPVRYARWLDGLTVARTLDAYYPDHPTALTRRFDLDREIPEAEVEALLVELLSAPVRADLADLVRRRLGRPLEAHDIYFEDLVPAPPIEALDQLVSARFADHAAFERALPEVLAELGFGAEDAAFYGTRVRVEIAKGAGHAVRPGRPEYSAWLRTSSLPDQLGWDGFDTAMHELGHNLEQLVSTHRVPRPALRGVPNTACTEAFAFLYQSLGRQVARVPAAPGAPDPFDLDTLQTMLAACQIAGPGLVELYAWRWLYAHPDAGAAALRDAVIGFAGEVWDRFYAGYYGSDPYHLLAAYQHMVAYPLYLPDYTLGHVISHQIRSHLRGRDLAGETQRICAIGRLTPDLWLRRAVGSGISVAPLVADTEEALGRAAKLADPM